MKELVNLLAGAVEDGWLSFYRGGWRSLFGTAVLALALVPLGALLMVDSNLRTRLKKAEEQMNLTLFATPELDEVGRAGLVEKLNAHPEIKATLAVSPETALARLEKLAPDLYATAREMRANPLPWSFEIELQPQARSPERLEKIRASLAGLPGAAGVDADLEWARGLREFSRGANAIGFSYALLLALGAVFTVGAVLKMTYLLKRDQVEIMRLVGATGTAVALPFFIEGGLIGLGGGLSALGLLKAGHWGLLQSRSPLLQGAAPYLTEFLSRGSAGMLLGAAFALGALGGLMTLGRAVQR